jgi:protein TonB
LNAFALEPIAHSRSTLVAVVVAHVAAGLLAVQLFEARRYIDPAPLVVDLLPAPERKVDVAPQPLPQAPEPLPEIKREPEIIKPKPELIKLEPELIKPEPIVREEPEPIERVVRPEPAPEIVPPPQQVAPPVPTPLPPMPEPVVVSAPEPTAITVPVPPAPVVVPQPVVEVPEMTMTAQMLTAIYLHNPKPSYPGASRRLGEQGTVFLRVFVSAVGDPTRIELKTSSGYPRLDQSAQDAVQRWKFVPAKRGEQAVDAWVVVPIKFSLKR